MSNVNFEAERIPCPTTGESIALCRDWTDQHVEPSEYQPDLEGGAQTCDRCGMVRHFTRERRHAALADGVEVRSLVVGGVNDVR